MAARSAHFDALLNFRDVGLTVNSLSSASTLRTGLLFRAARPDETTLADRKKLLDEYGIRHVIDLRTKTEHIEQAKKHKALVAASEAAPQSNRAAAAPLEIPGVTYHQINFNGDAYSKSLLAKLTWPQYLSVIGLMILGRRTQGIGVLGTNVMNPRGLIGLGLDSMDVCTQEVKQVFDVLADASNYPVLVHCTQGKDRTGLVVQLVLFLLGVPLEAINQDYLMTDGELDSEREERLKEIRSIGLDDSFAYCDKDMVENVNKHLLEKGGIENYLDSCGVTEEMRNKVKQILRDT